MLSINYAYGESMLYHYPALLIMIVSTQRMAMCYNSFSVPSAFYIRYTLYYLHFNSSDDGNKVKCAKESMMWICNAVIRGGPNMKFRRRGAIT